jgi:probable rRNA maturation factor
MNIRLIKQRGVMPLKCRARLVRVLKLAQELAGLGEETGTLNLILTPSDVMATMNEAYLGHEGRTDVLTFDLRDTEVAHLKADDAEECVAEVYVCPDVAVEYSAKFGTTPSRELVLYLVHGMLHLAGEDDLEEEARLSMRKAENRVMTALAERFSLEGFIA